MKEWLKISSARERGLDFKYNGYTQLQLTGLFIYLYARTKNNQVYANELI